MTARASLLAALVPLLLAGCQEAPPSLRNPFGSGPLPSFTLTDSRGQEFRPDRLKDKVWVAHFFFTTCTAGCSETATTMQHLQEVFRGHPHLALVSISINPENDEPEVLSRYASDLNAQNGQWHFLTAPRVPRIGEAALGSASALWHSSAGAERRVHDIVMKDFLQAVDRNSENKPGREFDHSFHLVLIDHEGNRVGYVSGKDVEARPALVARLKELLMLRRMAFEPQRVWFPRLNASLNGLCAVLLLAGYLAIKQRKEKLHIVCMVAALAVSAVFLACYLYYHFVVLDGRPTAFQGEGWIRAAYLGILLSHTILAVAVAPMAIGVAVLGFRDRRTTHVKWARWTFPLWLYVSVTGVVVYWMLYHLYPPY